MRIDEPLAIELEYVQRMMAWMLLARPRDAGARPCGAARPRRRRDHALLPSALHMRTHRRRDQPARHRRLPALVPPAAAIRRGWRCSRWMPRAWVADPAHAGSADVLVRRSVRPRCRGPVLDDDALLPRLPRLLAEGGLMTRQPVRPRRELRASIARIAAAFGAEQRLDAAADARRQHGRAGDDASHVPGPRRACPACRKHRNSLEAAGPQVAAHDPPAASAAATPSAPPHETATSPPNPQTSRRPQLPAQRDPQPTGARRPTRARRATHGVARRARALDLTSRPSITFAPDRPHRSTSSRSGKLDWRSCSAGCATTGS